LIFSQASRPQFLVLYKASDRVHQRRRSWGGQSSAGDRGARRATPGSGDLRGTGQRRFAWDRGAPMIVGQSSGGAWDRAVQGLICF